MKGQPGHTGEKVDVANADGAGAKLHLRRHQIKRLHQDADMLENQRIGEAAIFPRDATKARRHGDHDLRRFGRAHRVLPVVDDRLELARRHANRDQRVTIRVVMIKAARQPLAAVDREVKLQFIARTAGRIGARRNLHLALGVP